MKLSHEAETRILRLAAEGKTYIDIASTVGVNRNTVTRVLQRLGVYRPRIRPADEELVRLYRRHKSVTKVAYILDMAVSGIATRLRDLVTFEKKPAPTEEEQRRIVAMYKVRKAKGLTVKDIAEIHDLAPNSVSRIVRRWRERGHS